MIRIVLMLIGVAFCIMSSVTAPAHASPVMASLSDIPPGFLPPGDVPHYQDTTLMTVHQPGAVLPYSPDQCSPGKGPSSHPAENGLTVLPDTGASSP
jgi:hypothetical protein